MKNGCMAVCEGANMPTEQAGVDVFQSAKILFAPSQSTGIVILTNSDNGTSLHIELGCRWAAWATSQSVDEVCP